MPRKTMAEKMREEADAAASMLDGRSGLDVLAEMTGEDTTQSLRRDPIEEHMQRIRAFMTLKDGECALDSKEAQARLHEIVSAVGFDGIRGMRGSELYNYVKNGEADFWQPTEAAPRFED